MTMKMSFWLFGPTFVKKNVTFEFGDGIIDKNLALQSFGRNNSKNYS